MISKQLTRRSLIRSGLLFSAAGSSMALAKSEAHNAENESFWRCVRSCFSSSRRYVDLEGGVLNFMPELARHKFDRLRDECTAASSLDLRNISTQVSELASSTLRLPAKGMFVTRGHQASCTLAIQTLLEHAEKFPESSIACIHGSGLLQQMLVKAAGPHRVVAVDPWNKNGTLRSASAIMEAISALPNARALVLAYSDSATGLALPLEEILEFARQRHIITAADPSLMLGRQPLDLSAVRPDILVIDPAQWLGAPGAAGLVFSQLPLKVPHHFAPEDPAAIAALMAFPEALAFSLTLGFDSINQRQRYLNQLWLDAMHQNMGGVQILTAATAGDLPDLGTAAIRVRNVRDVSQLLLERHGYITYPLEHSTLGGLLRVMPNISQNSADLERFSLALVDSLS